MTPPSDASRMNLADSLPNRPLRRSEWEAIEEAGNFAVVKPVQFLYGEDVVPLDDSKEAALDLVVVASDWYAGLEFDPPGWTVVFHEERPDVEPVEAYDRAAYKIQNS